MKKIAETLQNLAVKIDAKDVGVPVIAETSEKEQAAMASLLGTVYAWAAIIAVLVIVIAGYLYATSGGNAQQTKRAREAIIYAAVGLAIVLLAFVITQFVIGRFE